MVRHEGDVLDRGFSVDLGPGPLETSITNSYERKFVKGYEAIDLAKWRGGCCIFIKHPFVHITECSSDTRPVTEWDTM